MEKVIKETTIAQSNGPHEVVTTTKKVEPSVVVEHPQVTYERKKTIFRAYQLAWFLVGLIEILLTFRFILKLIGANPYSGFAMLVYSISAPFAEPFWGVVSATGTRGSILEWSTIIAAIVFLVIGWGVVKVLEMIKPVTPEEVSLKVDN